MVVQRRDGPRRLRESDDDNDDGDGLSPADCPLFVCKGGVSATIFARWLSQNADVRSPAFCGPFVAATEHYEFCYRNK